MGIRPDDNAFQELVSQDALEDFRKQFYPDRKKEDIPVFYQHEEINIRGNVFIVRSIERERLVLTATSLNHDDPLLFGEKIRLKGHIFLVAQMLVDSVILRPIGTAIISPEDIIDAQAQMQQCPYVTPGEVWDLEIGRYKVLKVTKAGKRITLKRL